MKVLLIRFSSIGDIVLTTPIIRCARLQLRAELHYLTKPAFVTMLTANPYLDKIHTLQDSLTDTIIALRKEKFDLIIDLHHNLRSAIIKAALGVPAQSFPKLNLEKWLLTRFHIDRLPPIHIVDRYMSTLSSLGVVNDGEGLDYYIPAEDRIEMNAMPSTHQQGYTAWVIGAKMATKRLPASKIIEGLGCATQPVILLGGPEDVTMAIEIMTAGQYPIPVYNACGRYNLNQSASIVSQASHVITNDTGLMHIAAAFLRPITSYWGSTIPALGMTPYYGKHQVTTEIKEVKNLRCRPCSKIGYAHCPQGHFHCMLLQQMNSAKGI